MLVEPAKYDVRADANVFPPRVRAETIPVEAWEMTARGSGLSDYAVEALLKMFRYYEQYGLAGNPNVLAWLLRHPPTTLAEFVERTRSAA